MRCGERFNGEAKNLYLTQFERNRSLKLRYVICPECVTALTSEWEKLSLYRDAFGQWNSQEEGTSLNDLWTLQEDRQLPWERRQAS